MGKVEAEVKVDERPVVITVTIMPVKDGKRMVVMSGAPEGEMPELAFGTFPAMHTMLDQIWMKLRTRKPVVVKKPEVKKVDASGTDDADDEDGEKTVEEQLATARAKFDGMTAEEIKAENDVQVGEATKVATTSGELED